MGGREGGGVGWVVVGWWWAVGVLMGGIVAIKQQHNINTMLCEPLQMLKFCDGPSISSILMLHGARVPG